MTSYIKDQLGRFSLWCDNTNSTPVITLAQATSQGFLPGITQPIPPQQQLALPAPLPPVTVNIGDYMKAMIPQDYSMVRPDSRFQEPNMTFDDNFDFNDTFYRALPEDKERNIKMQN